MLWFQDQQIHYKHAAPPQPGGTIVALSLCINIHTFLIQRVDIAMRTNHSP